MYGDENRAPEQNLALLGDMHRRAFEAIGNYRLPDYSNIRKLEDMYDVFAFINGLGSMDKDIGWFDFFPFTCGYMKKGALSFLYLN